MCMEKFHVSRKEEKDERSVKKRKAKEIEVKEGNGEETEGY